MLFKCAEYRFGHVRTNAASIKDINKIRVCNGVVRNAQLIQVMSFYFIGGYILYSYCTLIRKVRQGKRTIISSFVKSESKKNPE